MHGRNNGEGVEVLHRHKSLQNFFNGLSEFIKICSDMLEILSDSVDISRSDLQCLPLVREGPERVIASFKEFLKSP